MMTMLLKRIQNRQLLFANIIEGLRFRKLESEECIYGREASNKRDGFALT